MDIIVGAPGDSEDPVEQVQLNDEEVNAAIYEGKKKKYFHERNKHRWPEQDAYDVKERFNDIANGKGLKQ